MVRRQIEVVGQTVNDDGAGRRDLPPPYPLAPSLSLYVHAIVGEPSIRGEDVLGKNLAYNLQRELRNGINPVPGEGAGRRSTLTLPQKEVSP